MCTLLKTVWCLYCMFHIAPLAGLGTALREQTRSYFQREKVNICIRPGQLLPPCESVKGLWICRACWVSELWVGHWVHIYCKQSHCCTGRCAELFLTAEKLGVLPVSAWKDGINCATFVLLVLCSCQKSELDFYVLTQKDELLVLNEKTSYRSVCGCDPTQKIGRGVISIYACICFRRRKSCGRVHTTL